MRNYKKNQRSKTMIASKITYIPVSTDTEYQTVKELQEQTLRLDKNCVCLRYPIIVDERNKK